MLSDTRSKIDRDLSTFRRTALGIGAQLASPAIATQDDDIANGCRGSLRLVPDGTRKCVETGPVDLGQRIHAQDHDHLIGDLDGAMGPRGARPSLELRRRRGEIQALREDDRAPGEPDEDGTVLRMEAEEMRHTKGYEVPLPVYCRRFECGIAEMDQVLSGIGMDVLPEGFTVDGQTIGREAGEVRISSLSELRQIERDSEQKFRNGEGQIVAFREFSQDRGNRTRNVFTDTSYETGRSRKIEKPKTQSNLPISVRATKS